MNDYTNFLTIEMTRGDSKSFKFKTKDKTGAVIETQPDKMWLSFKYNSGNKNVVFQKKLSDNTITFDSDTKYYTFEIKPEDTNGLAFGEYMWDCEVIRNGKKDTIKKGFLILTEEITSVFNEVA